MTDLLDWERLGQELRAIALECGGPLPPPDHAYKWLLLELPEYFFYAAWPEGMPADPPAELVEAYLGT